jgi:ribonuclease-3
VIVGEEGPEHQKVFTVEVVVNGKAYARGQGPNKKKAEQEASRLSLETLVAEVEKAEAEKAAKAEATPKIKVQKQRHIGLP